MLELRHLATLDAVAVAGTFGRAADRLGYTQSAVSQQIAALEKAVGGAVFDRPGGPRAVRLTPLGEVLLAHARELLARAATAEDAVERFKAGEGRVTIGTFQSVTNALLPRVVRQVRAQYPRCDIRLSEQESDPPPLDDLDLLFFDGRVPGDVEQVKIIDDPYVLVAPPGMFPAGPVPLAALDGAPMVAQPPICDQARVERTLAEMGVAPLIVFRTADNHGVLAMVHGGLGVAVVPSLALALAHEELSTHDLAIAPREIWLAWRAGRTHSPLARRVIELSVEAGRTASGARRTGPRPRGSSAR
jgi:DNA-binding transcriptional LysR family regulator